MQIKRTRRSKKFAWKKNMFKNFVNKNWCRKELVAAFLEIGIVFPNLERNSTLISMLQILEKSTF